MRRPTVLFCAILCVLPLLLGCGMAEKEPLQPTAAAPTPHAAAMPASTEREA